MKNKLKIFIIFSSVFLFIYTTTILVIYFCNFNTPSDNPANWAQFGDYLGGLLNPFISFFAFIGLILTIFLEFGDKDEILYKNDIRANIERIDTSLDIVMNTNQGTAFYNFSLLKLLINYNTSSITGDFEKLFKYHIRRFKHRCTILNDLLELCKSKNIDVSYERERSLEYEKLLNDFFKKTNISYNDYINE